MASASNILSLPVKIFSGHGIFNVRRLRLHIFLPRLSFPFYRHSNCTVTSEYAAALAASPSGDFIENPFNDASAVETLIFRTLSSRQKEQISIFISALLQWNEWMNLTAVMQEDEVMTRHVEDSLALLPPLRRSYLSLCCSSSPHCDGLKLVDVGSGSGFPGLIIAIACPTWKITLIESMQKRCSFLEYVVIHASLTNVEVLRERAENAGQCIDFRELFDVAVARAVAEMRILAEYCLPLVRVGGLFIAAKGHNPQEEIRNSEKAIRLLGGSIVELCAVESHSPLGQRTAVICFKDHATPRKYPRETGIPSKMPLN